MLLGRRAAAGSGRAGAYRSFVRHPTPCGPAGRTLAGGPVAAMAAAAEGVLAQEDIWPGILRTYDAAQASGAATKTETKVEVVTDGPTGLSFVIRLATALRAKPKGPPAAEGAAAGAAPAPKKAEWRNPFLPPEPELLVGHLSDTHSLVLNKFNVVAHHSLVITKDFEQQSDPLNLRDLEATWRVLKVMPTGGLAFYNSGEHSGRSQPHKHLQIVPLPFAEGMPAQPPIQPAVEAAAKASGPAAHAGFKVSKLPFQAYAALLDDPSPEQLELCFQQLLQMGAEGVRRSSQQGQGQEQGGQQQQQQQQQGNNSYSYNFVMTTEIMMLVPRRAEMCGPLAINSLGFAGTLLVRSEEEAAFVREKGCAHILTEVSLPS